MNAYLGPVMQTYMENFRASVKKENIPVEPYITQSYGGIISIQESVSSPVKTALSGPAAGVVAASHVAKLTGYKDLITFDMGGTSADFRLLLKNKLESSRKSVKMIFLDDLLLCK